MDHLKHRIDNLTLDKQRAGQLEADMKQAKTAHDKALAAAQQGHQQQLEETLACKQKALKEAKTAHEQAVEVHNFESYDAICRSCVRFIDVESFAIEYPVTSVQNTL